MIIPFNIASGTYTLKLFNEHINSDFKTDYASAFADVTLPANSAIGKNGEDGVTPYVGENGNWWIGGTDTGVRAAAGTSTATVIALAAAGAALAGNAALAAYVLSRRRKSAV